MTSDNSEIGSLHNLKVWKLSLTLTFILTLAAMVKFESMDVMLVIFYGCQSSFSILFALCSYPFLGEKVLRKEKCKIKAFGNISALHIRLGFVLERGTAASDRSNPTQPYVFNFFS